MKKRNLTTIFSAFACAAVMFVAGCGRSPSSAAFALPDYGMLDFHTDLQTGYLTDSRDSILTYADGMKELSRPEALHLEWDDLGAARYVVELSLKGDFSDTMQYETLTPSVDLYNLLVMSAYSWRVTAVDEAGGTESSQENVFMTGPAPRNLYVDGITNVRDLGGWATEQGGLVKQGMIFRCGRLNRSSVKEPEIEITEEGIRTMKEELGVRMEIDLRLPTDPTGNNGAGEVGGISQSPLGDGVAYHNVALTWESAGNLLLVNQASVREFFRLAADEKNYPFIFHCNIGTDRTGLFSILINGLLGVAEEDLYRDYLFSNFANIGGSREVERLNNYLGTIKEASGNTFSEKVENALLSIGVLQEHLDSLKAIMSE